jgi:hypothetical protein
VGQLLICRITGKVPLGCWLPISSDPDNRPIAFAGVVVAGVDRRDSALLLSFIVSEIMVRLLFLNSVIVCLSEKDRTRCKPESS